jgi:hypothetical protein
VDAVIEDEDHFLDNQYIQTFDTRLPELSRILPNLRRIFIRHVRWSATAWILSKTWGHHVMRMRLNSVDYLKDWEDLSKSLFVPGIY